MHENFQYDPFDTEPTTPAPVQLHGRVTRLFTKARNPSSSSSFSAGILELSDIDFTHGDQSVKFAGPIEVDAGANVILHGEWTTHEKYGRQFSATYAQADIGFTRTGVINFLANNSKFIGIGPAKARQLVDLLDLTQDLPSQLERDEDISRIHKKTNIPVETLQLVADEFSEQTASMEPKIWLAQFGLTQNQIDKIVHEFGVSTKKTLTENPYKIIRAIPGFGFRRVDGIAQKMGVALDASVRVQAAITYASLLSTESGNTLILRDKLIDDLNKLLLTEVTIDGNFHVNYDKEIETAVNTKHVISVHDYYANPSMFEKEQYIHTKITCNGNAKNPHINDINYDMIETEAFQESFPDIYDRIRIMNKEQLVALQRSLNKKISIISGAAGTGKTFCVKALVEIYEKNGWKVELAAPTGKAARRMEESCGHTAQTLHRLLGLMQDDYTTSMFVNADVIIVDEFSMVDVNLAYALFHSIHFESTSLVILGDPNQLPPVGPGSLLRDFIESGMVLVSTLTHVVRQENELLKKCCNNILYGRFERVDPPDEVRNPFLLLPFGNQRQILSFFENKLFDMLKYYGIHPNDFQVLSPKKSGDLGTENLNLLLQNKLHGITESNDINDILVGDRVINVKNNYELDVMNGQIGFVKSTNPIRISWDDGIEREHEDWSNITLAYALTIHKSQGSEFPLIVVVCHSSQYYMLNRRLLYTAVTRAKRFVIVVGDQRGFDHAVSSVNHVERLTYFGWKNGRTC